jgi:hypothetical protein
MKTKKNIPIQNILGSTSRRTSTERKKNKKNLYYFYAELPCSRVDYTKRRKTERKKENIPIQNSLESTRKESFHRE